MKTKCESIMKEIKDWAKIALAVYIVGGSCYNIATKTGHPSADIYLGLSKPTKLQRFLVKSLGGNLENISQESRLNIKDRK